MPVVLDWSESPAPNPKLRELVKGWLDGNLSEQPAMAGSQRNRALALVEAVEVDGLDHSHLPADFLAKHWFPRMRGAPNVLVTAAGKMLDYLRQEGHLEIPVQTRPEFEPPRSRKRAKAAAAAAAAADEQPAEEQPVKKTKKRPAPTPVAIEHPNHPLTLVEDSPMPSASVFAFPPPPVADEPRRGKPANPVAALIPPEHRLRIYKKGEPGQLDSHLLDMPSAMVARYGTGTGAVTTILNDVVRPKWGPLPGERAVYRLVQVSPQGAEGNATEAALEGESPAPAPVVGVPAAPMIVPTHDQLAALQQQQVQVQAQIEALQALQAQRGPGVDQALDTTLHSLQERIEQLQAQLQTMRPAGPGDFGTAALGAMTGMVDKMIANKPDTDKQPSMMELLTYSQAQADRQRQADREFFQLLFKKDETPKTDPAVLAILERMDARLAELEEDDEPEVADDGLSGIKKFMETAEFLKKHMGIEAGPTMRSKEPENVLGLLRELMNQAPAIIAEYRQTVPVVAAARLGQVQEAQAMAQQAAQGKPALAAGQAAPAQAAQTPEQQQAAVRARLPVDVKASIEKLLTATADEQIGDAVGALVQQMEVHAKGNPQALNVFKTLEQDVVAGNLDKTVARLRQIFVFFGYNAEAPVPKVVEIAKTIIRLVKELDAKNRAQAQAQGMPETQVSPGAPDVAPALHVVTDPSSSTPAAELKDEAGPADEEDGEEEEEDGEPGDEDEDEDEDEPDADEPDDDEETEEPAAAAIAAVTVAPPPPPVKNGKNGASKKVPQAAVVVPPAPAVKPELQGL